MKNLTEEEKERLIIVIESYRDEFSRLNHDDSMKRQTSKFYEYGHTQACNNIIHFIEKWF